MKYIALALFAAIVTIASTHEASAVVCAKGVVRAGCAGVRGTLVVRKPVAVAPRRAVIAPRCVWINGVRVCR